MMLGLSRNIVEKIKKDLEEQKDNSWVASNSEEFSPSSSIGREQHDPRFGCISLEQLLEMDRDARAFYEKEHQQEPELSGEHYYYSKTMREINRDLVLPICENYGTSYARYKNPTGLNSDDNRECITYAFVSHCWDEPFHEFVESIQEALSHSLTKPHLWICSFALRQDAVPEELYHKITSDRHTNFAFFKKNKERSFKDCPFVRALKDARYFLVVRNSATDMYTRIWCVLELIFADEFGFIATEGRTMVAGDKDRRFADTGTSCLDATSFSLDDRERILKFILTRKSRAEVDKLINKMRQF